jgi:hypothetical protein
VAVRALATRYRNRERVPRGYRGGYTYTTADRLQTTVEYSCRVSCRVQYSCFVSFYIVSRLAYGYSVHVHVGIYGIRNSYSTVCILYTRLVRG